jgi:hypothetical protein
MTALLLLVLAGCIFGGSWLAVRDDHDPQDWWRR